MIIREERIEDYKQTEWMTMRAFWNIHGPGCNEHLLVHKIRESKDYLPKLSRVAEIDGKIVGAIFFTKAWIKDGEKEHGIVTFGPLCVDPMYQSRQVGAALLKETIALAKEAGYPGIVIFGEPDYYPKHGFVTCDHFGITDCEGRNFDAFMAYELQKDGFAHISGKFYEAEVFEACEDETELEKFTSQFPFCPKLKLACQWLHKERLGRISNVQKNCFSISYWEAELPARCKGDFYKGKKTYPIVGDYVTFEYQPNGDSRILEVCERKSVLKRPFPRDHSVKNTLEQEMVANVDACFIVSSLNDNFNVNRIIRYAATVRQGNVKPVVVLTKADLCEKAERYIDQITANIPETEVLAVSAKTGEGMDGLQKYCVPGTTIALLGSSGVGKSTLVNALLGEEIMTTSEIRERDAKGRHTTTTRQLLTAENGVTFVDTPGMREIALGDVTGGIDETFLDIVELEKCCKFNNCRHITEPGCAIKAAIAAGNLSEERFAMYQSMQQESRQYFDRKAVALKRRERKKHGKR